MTAYYNEIDHYAAQWLRNLIAAGHIAPGDVDERSIVDVRPDDLTGYTQCHFFAGIGGWSYALRLAGWNDDRPIWTGSCPCQPLSSAGQRKGHLDARHLWPAFHSLIAECSPAIVAGEQVASADGREWLAGVRADLEAVGYAIGGADLCAAGAGAPHIRQRLYWLADADSTSQYERPSGGQQSVRDRLRGCNARLGYSEPSERWPVNLSRADEGEDGDPQRQESAGGIGSASSEGHSAGVALGNTSGSGLQREWGEYRPSGERHSGLVGLAVQTGVPEWNGTTIAIDCSDGPRRASAQSGAFPLAHGVPARMGKLRAAGNAIVPQVAAEFIGAFMDLRP